jgi:phage tail sheath gpL-like
MVVTDLQETGWDAGDRVTVPDAVNVEVADVGAAPPNLAVTAARAAGDRILATVRNTGSAPASAHLRLNVHESADAASATRVAEETTLPLLRPRRRAAS